MKELFKKAKQNSLLGCRIRRMFKMKGFALAMLALVCVAFVGAAWCTDDAVMQVMGVVLAAAPVAFVVPDIEGMTDADKKTAAALAKSINDWIGEFKSGLIDGDDLNTRVKNAFDAFVKEYGIDKDKFKKIEDALKEQGLEIKALKEAPGGVKPLREQLKGLLSKENIDEIRKAGGSRMVGIELKAAATMTTGNAASAPHGLSFEVLPGVQESAREVPVVLSALSKGTTSSRTIIWINRVNEDGGAAFIAEGALKPLKDWDYAEENSVAKKVAVSAKVSAEMLHDFDYMEGEIRMLLTRDLYQVIDEKLLNGSAATDPAGIIPGAGGYIGTGLDGLVERPNNADAIRAAMLQMRLLSYRPDVVFLNPTDSAVMDLTKSSTGNYIKIELEGILRSLRVIETTEIAAGDFLLMDTAKWVVKILEGLRLEFGWENDDFRKNLITIIAELRLHSYQNSIDAGSVIYDAFATVKDAIEAP
jgi:HK97 family phage major capsid protein